MYFRKNPNIDSTINQAKDVISTSWQNNGARLTDLTNALNNFWGSDEASDDATDKPTQKPLRQSTYRDQLKTYEFLQVVVKFHSELRLYTGVFRIKHFACQRDFS